MLEACDHLSSLSSDQCMPSPDVCPLQCYVMCRHMSCYYTSCMFLQKCPHMLCNKSHIPKVIGIYGSSFGPVRRKYFALFEKKNCVLWTKIILFASLKKKLFASLKKFCVVRKKKIVSLEKKIFCVVLRHKTKYEPYTNVFNIAKLFFFSTTQIISFLTTQNYIFSNNAKLFFFNEPKRIFFFQRTQILFSNFRRYRINMGCCMYLGH